MTSEAPTYLAGGRGVTPVFACISAQSTSKLLPQNQSRAYRCAVDPFRERLELNQQHQAPKACPLPIEVRVSAPVARETFAALHNFRATNEKVT